MPPPTRGAAHQRTSSCHPSPSCGSFSQATALPSPAPASRLPPLQHVKAMHFTIVLGLAGLAVLWRAAALPSIGGAAGLSIPNATGDVLTIFTVVLYGVVGLL